jgi:hypothetical protein
LKTREDKYSLPETGPKKRPFNRAKRAAMRVNDVSPPHEKQKEDKKP